MITLMFLIALCSNEYCINVSEVAAIVAMCESGDQEHIGTVDFDAININTDNTTDHGAWQLNSYWIWNKNDMWILNRVAKALRYSSNDFIRRFPTATDASPYIQYEAFKQLYNLQGLKPWQASKSCWNRFIAE